MKPNDPNSPEKKDENLVRQGMLALSLPSIMVAGPVTGGLLGWGAARLFKFDPPWDQRAIMIGIFVGIAAAVRETVQVIKRISREE